MSYMENKDAIIQRLLEQSKSLEKQNKLLEKRNENLEKKVELLSSGIAYLEKENQLLRDEIAILKNKPPRPKLRPSIISKKDSSITRKSVSNKKKSKKNPSSLEIHEEFTVDIDKEQIPEGYKFVGYKNVCIQGIKILPNNTRYKLSSYKNGSHRLIAKLPSNVIGNYDVGLLSLILSLHTTYNMSCRQIQSFLREHNISLSLGKISNILTKNNDVFHKENLEVLKSGILYSKSITIDDTGHRHKGKNGHCTHLGSDYFSYFVSSDKKNRLNFLNILNLFHNSYYISQYSLDYLASLHNFPKDKILLFSKLLGNYFENIKDFIRYLYCLGIRDKYHIKRFIESGLIGNIRNQGYFSNTSIVSDGASQFNGLPLQGLCWIHIERRITDVIAINDAQIKKVNKIKEQFWRYYKLLKKYKDSPNRIFRTRLLKLFDSIFTQETNWKELDEALYSIYKNKKRLLLVLNMHHTHLHTNISENAIRGMVIKRKVIYGTRSDLGRKCRDTFMSLKQTCQKLGIHFKEYLIDRLTKENNIQPLANIIQSKSTKYVTT